MVRLFAALAVSILLSPGSWSLLTDLITPDGGASVDPWGASPSSDGSGSVDPWG